MSYRDDVEALAARQADLTREVATKARELADTSRILEDARARARLPVLDNIRVASPCDVPWSSMTGDERVRHCKSCDKQVFNLSELSREQAEALVIEKAGKLCVRYFRRNDGTILLGDDCKVGRRRKRTRIALIAGATAAALGSAAVAYQITHPGPDGVDASWEQGEVAVREGDWTMGRIAVEPMPLPPLDDGAIASAIQKVHPLIEDCRTRFPAHGNLQLDIHVGPAGGIAEVTVAKALTRSYDLEACLVSALHQARFAPSEGGAVLSYPLVF